MFQLYIYINTIHILSQHFYGELTIADPTLAHRQVESPSRKMLGYAGYDSEEETPGALQFDLEKLGKFQQERWDLTVRHGD